ncbi:MAG TPA: hypothetical protein VGN23_12370, partial [Verrucomicrobiae bacterium]
MMIAQLTNSAGELVNSNQAVYPAAFAGLDADLTYTYRKGGFEQDVVLHEQPPSPESFGLNPTNTRLQVLTEFFNPPNPKIKTHPLSRKSKINDITLRFGKSIMGNGKAFSFGTQTNTSPTSTTIVTKNWLKLQGRTFLIE